MAASSWGNMLKALCQNFYEWMQMQALYTYWERSAAQVLSQSGLAKALICQAICDLWDVEAELLPASLIVCCGVRLNSLKSHCHLRDSAEEQWTPASTIQHRASDGSTSWAVTQTLDSQFQQATPFNSIRVSVKSRYYQLAFWFWLFGQLGSDCSQLTVCLFGGFSYRVRAAFLGGEQPHAPSSSG